MKEIYLIRHTTPAVAKGICYGQTDLDITESFHEEAAVIRQYLPEGIVSVHSSPLQRCSRLASHLFPAHPIVLHDELMEIHCGEWEMRGWDDLPKEEIDPWMKDFVQVRIPGGESYLDLHQRVTRCYETIRTGSSATREASTAAASCSDAGPLAIVAHGGVIRSILSSITNTPLIDSFKVFSLHYGCVIRLFGETDLLQYEMLSNRPPEEKEQHKPRSF
ncbi:MAG TPA: alpha-ribazole phosphatase family protein [Puia sp.]